MLTSNRIRLRLLKLNDLTDVHELHSLVEIDEFNTLGIPTDMTQTKSTVDSWVRTNELSDIRNYTFVIELIEGDIFVGLFGLKLWDLKHRRGEVWYKIHSKFWGKGIATESLNLVLDFGFNSLELHRIQAGCAVENAASIKVLEKVGMIKEGRGRQILPLKSGWSDNFEYSILDTDKRIYYK
jgi:RimJ/RimL family protein N-acetyltransferase